MIGKETREEERSGEKRREGDEREVRGKRGNKDRREEETWGQ